MVTTATPFAQGIMYFRDSAEQEGWSEACYFASTDINDIYNKLRNTIIPARKTFLVKSCSIFAARVSLVNNPVRKFFLGRFLTPEDGSDDTTENELEDCIVLRGFTTDGNNRLFEFRGIGDEYIRNGMLTGNGQDLYSNQILPYMATLKTAGAQLRVPAANTIYPILSIHNDVATGLVKVFFDNLPADFATSPFVVRIRGVKGFPLINASWKVQSVDAANKGILLAGSGRYQCDVANVGTAQLVQQGVKPLDSYNFVFCSTRKTGRPFGSRRGRKSKAILRR